MPVSRKRKPTSAGRCRPSRGVSMIELMIAVTVALVLLAALASMYGTSIQTRNQIERANRQVENGRYAIQLLREDIQLAGYFGELNMRDLGPPLPPAVPGVCVTHATGNAALPDDGVVTTDLSGDAAIDGLDYLAAVMGVHVQGFDDVTAGGLPACLSGVDMRPGTDVIIVRRVATCAAGAAGCTFTASAPYLQTSQCNTQINTPGAGNIFRLRADADMGQFALMDLSCTAGTTTPVRRYLTHMYFIANNNVAGDGIPTLKRRELVAGGFTTTALVEGIEDLQLQYGLDRDVDAAGNPDPRDGAPDAYVGLPADVQGWNDVVTVRIHLLSRSTEPRPGYADENRYTLGTKVIAAPGDAFTRQVFETAVQLRNAAGRRQ